MTAYEAILIVAIAITAIARAGYSEQLQTLNPQIVQSLLKLCKVATEIDPPIATKTDPTFPNETLGLNIAATTGSKLPATLHAWAVSGWVTGC